MWLKALNVLAQIIIIILALVVVFTMSKKQMIDSTFSSFQKRIDEQLAEDRKHYDEKIGMVQDNLNRYQLNREQRAKFLTTRIDELYDLYKKDPTPITHHSTPSPPSLATENTSIVDKNFSYFESKINRTDEKLDVMENRLSSKVTILEQRVEALQVDKKNNSKVIQNSIQTVNNNIQK